MNALLIHIEPKPSTVAFRASEQRLDDVPALVFALRRWIDASAGRLDTLFVACPDACLPAWRERLTALPGATAVPDAGQGLAAVMRDVSNAHRVETLAVLPENALLPDCERSLRLIASHRRGRFDVTAPTGWPIGLLPPILSAKGIEWFADQASSVRTFRDLVQTLGALVRRPAVTGLSVGRVRPPAGADALLETLPGEVLIGDELGVRAAARAIARCGTPLPPDHEPAVQYKRALLELFAEPIPIRTRLRRSPAKTVLVSSVQPAFSGGEESLFQLLVNLDRERYRPVAVFPCRTVLADKLAAAGVDIECAGRDAATATAATLDYYDRLVRELDVAVIHVDGYVLGPLMCVGRLKRIPVVAHVRRLLPLYGQTELGLADAIIGISDAVTSTLRRRTLARDVVRTIYNGVDLQRFQPSPDRRAEARATLAIDPAAKTICFVGRITPQKQHHTLLEALPRVLDEAPGAMVLFVGDIYDAAYAASLRDLAARSGVAHRVRWLGFRSDLETIYAASDVLVLGRPLEPFGRCVIEAMAMGVPCVVPDTAGPAEIVRHEVDGLTFDARSPAALAAALGRVLTDDPFSAHLSRGAVRRARDFDARRHASQVETLYDELLAGMGRHACSTSTTLET